MSCSAKSCVPNISAAIFPDRTSCSSSGTVVPSTRPVVIVTFLIHSSSRCSVVGAPCTPMLAMTPPGRTPLVQMSKVPGVPTASIATSAPSPPSVSAMTCCSAFASAALIVTSAPNRRACSSRVSAISSAMMLAAPASADDHHDVTRLDPAVPDAHLVAGRQDVGQEKHLLVGHALGHLVHA